MDHRQTFRVMATLPVRIWGVDAHAQPFMQLASVTNISRSGAALRGMNRQLLPGEILEVQFGRLIAQFRVMWVGQMGTAQQGEVGIVSLPLPTLHLGSKRRPLRPTRRKRITTILHNIF